jgi:hypothetical protein
MRAFRPSQAEMHIYRIEVLKEGEKNVKFFNIFRHRFLLDNLNAKHERALSAIHAESHAENDTSRIISAQ